MYRVYCDEHLLYHTTLDNLKIFDPSLELELNKTGSFDFTVHTDHPYYNLIKKLKSIITVFQDDYLLFRGRVLDDEIGWHNEKLVMCEGDLSFLLDSIQRPFTFTGTVAAFLAYIIERHNSQVETEKRFSIGSVTVTGNVAVTVDEYTNTFEIVQNQLISAFGGYVRTRMEDGVVYLDYLEKITLLAPQKIQFGKNLLDLKRIRKGADIATALIPLGAEGLTIDSVNNGLDYIVDETAKAQFGFIVKTVTFDGITDARTLLQKGQAQLSDLVNNMESIELSAADLATVDKSVTSFHLGTQVRVTSNPHGIDQLFTVSKLSLNLLDPAANSLVLGKNISTFSESVVFKKGDPGKPGEPGQKGDPGQAGAAGSPGKDGISITHVDVMYYQSTSSTALSGGTWQTTAPAWVNGRFFWEKTVVTYSDGTTEESQPVCITGQRGQTGATGATGPTGPQGSPGAPGKDGANGKDGAPGKDGVNGKDGKDAAVQSLTAPSDTSFLWLDINLDPPLLKRYDPEAAAWVVVNDTTNIVYNLEQNFKSDIIQSEENITLKVAEGVYLKDETDALVSEVSSKLEQTASGFEMQFNQFSADLEAVASGADAEFEEIRKYIRYVDGQILLGEVGNELELKISNDRISFLQDGAEVAYFSNRKLYVTDAEVLHSMKLGNFAFMPRANGNLSFKKL